MSSILSVAKLRLGLVSTLGGALGADAQAEGAVFDVTTGEDGAVLRQQGGADEETAVGGVGFFPRLAGGFVEGVPVHSRRTLAQRPPGPLFPGTRQDGRSPGNVDQSCEIGSAKPKNCRATSEGSPESRRTPPSGTQSTGRCSR